jgi:radical SAM superfamily enzyme YgiQ (UPF0313 family)
MNFSNGTLDLMSRSSQDEVQAFVGRLFPAGHVRRILFVNPPDGEAERFRLDTALRRRYPNYPPYGPAVLAQQVRRIGIEPSLLNLNHEVLKACHEAGSEEMFDFDAAWQARLDEAIESFRPDLIGVTCMFTMTHTSLKRVCEHAARSGIPVAIGGVHVSNDIEWVLDDIPSVQIAFHQEADLALGILCRFVNGEVDIDELGQVILRDGEERYRFPRPLRPTSEEMDAIPAYDLFDVSNLSRYGVIGNFHGFKPRESRFATVLSNRGCRAQCTFCSVRNFNGKTVRQRSVDSVLDELELLTNEYGIEHIVWLDDDLLKDHDRALSLFNGMVRRNLGLTWDATNGVIAASCTDDMVAAMTASGCIALNIGMESGNPEILKQIKKPGTVKNFLNAAEVFHRHPQIHARVFLMLGFPGETMAMINDTINVAREMDMDWSAVTPLQPLPNTPIFDSMVEQGLIDGADRSDVRFQGGGYGRQEEIDRGLKLAAQSFEDAFCAIPLDAVPTREQVNDIWFYMNYHLNFHRLFSEEREFKLRQQMMNLTALTDVISPEHGFALYFLGYLQHKVDGRIEKGVVERLERKLQESDYWSDRFKAFGLSVDDLRTRNFKNKRFPRLLPGKLPDDDRRFEDLVFET